MIIFKVFEELPIKVKKEKTNAIFVNFVLTFVVVSIHSSIHLYIQTNEHCTC